MEKREFFVVCNKLIFYFRNLKLRSALPDTANLKDVGQLFHFNAEIECGQPNKNISEFVGCLRVENKILPIGMFLLHSFSILLIALLGIKEFLLRGAQLKNTRWIVGIVVYTGKDSKLLQNAKAAPLKR